MSAACLVIGGFLVLFWWSENASNSSKEDGASLTSSLRTIFGNREILLCGTVQSLFGGCMYIFVFFWTPALKGCEPGLVFCCFMIAVMIGSGIFEELEKRGWSLVDIVCLVLAGASISFAIPLVTDEIPIRLGGFILYEICVGIWFPSYHTLRMQLVPDKGHATVLSFFRFPLNIITTCAILYSNLVSMEFIFSCMYVMMWMAMYCTLQIRSILVRSDAKMMKVK